LNRMDIQYGASVVDKNDRRIGTVNKVILDIWSGEPRKYAVRLDGQIDMVFFTPQQVDTATADSVKLAVTREEIEGA
jgi:sporulation protein YlmC with PRC-barrel domain